MWARETRQLQLLAACKLVTRHKQVGLASCNKIIIISDCWQARRARRACQPAQLKQTEPSLGRISGNELISVPAELVAYLVSFAASGAARAQSVLWANRKQTATARDDHFKLASKIII